MAKCKRDDISIEMICSMQSISNGFRRRLTEVGKWDSDTIDKIMEAFDETAAGYIFIKKSR